MNESTNHCSIGISHRENMIEYWIDYCVVLIPIESSLIFKVMESRY